MVIVGWVLAWMEVVVGRHAGQSQGRLTHVGRSRSTSRVRGEDTGWWDVGDNSLRRSHVVWWHW